MTFDLSDEELSTSLEKHRKQVKNFINLSFVVGEDYLIESDQKILLVEGAEKLLELFRLIIRYNENVKEENEGESYYVKTHCILVDAKHSIVVDNWRQEVSTKDLELKGIDPMRMVSLVVHKANKRALLELTIKTFRLEEEFKIKELE